MWAVCWIFPSVSGQLRKCLELLCEFIRDAVSMQWTLVRFLGQYVIILLGCDLWTQEIHLIEWVIICVVVLVFCRSSNHFRKISRTLLWHDKLYWRNVLSFPWGTYHILLCLLILTTILLVLFIILLISEVWALSRLQTLIIPSIMWLKTPEKIWSIFPGWLLVLLWNEAFPDAFILRRHNSSLRSVWRSRIR